PRLPQRDELPLTLFPCGLLARPQGTIHCLQVFDVLGHLRQGLACDIQSAVNATDETFQPRLCTPPFCACRLRSSDARTSCNASLIRTPGGCSGPPWSSLSIPRTAAQYPNTTSPASSVTAGSAVTAPAVVSRALAVWPPPRSRRAQASGAAASGWPHTASRLPGAAWGQGQAQGQRCADAPPAHGVRSCATRALCSAS